MVVTSFTTRTSLKPITPPRFDVVLEELIGPWSHPQTGEWYGTVDEVMRSCGGAIQGFKEVAKVVPVPAVVPVVIEPDCFPSQDDPTNNKKYKRTITTDHDKMEPWHPLSHAKFHERKQLDAQPCNLGTIFI